MAINNWYWKRYDTRSGYAEEAYNLWKFDYRLTDGNAPRLGKYQVLQFHDEPGQWRIRFIPAHNADIEPSYSKTSCLPKVFKRLSDAQTAAEMLEITHALHE